MKHYIAILLTVFLLLSCQENTPRTTINLELANIDSMRMSEYFESIEYIKLETKPECLINNNPTIYAIDNSIIVISSNNCYQFNRTTGQFIKKIGMEGRGPNEYLQIPAGLILNENKKTIITHNGSNIIEYSLTDEKDITKAPTEVDIKVSIGKIANLGDDNWIVGILDPTGNAPNKLVFFNRSTVIDSLPNNNKFTMETNELNLNNSEILFYRYNSEVYYKFLYNDTIFRIENNRVLAPQWNFKSANSVEALAGLRGNPSKFDAELSKYYLIYGIIETNRYMFINSRYKSNKHLFLYDKKLGELTKLIGDGFVNDMFSSVAFWPKYTNDNQELISVYQADFILDLMQTNRDIATKNSKFQEIASQLSPEDNPVVVIAKLKQQ